jgi:hypothetical protein
MTLEERLESMVRAKVMSEAQANTVRKKATETASIAVKPISASAQAGLPTTNLVEAPAKIVVRPKPISAPKRQAVAKAAKKK